MIGDSVAAGRPVAALELLRGAIGRLPLALAAWATQERAAEVVPLARGEANVRRGEHLVLLRREARSE